MTLNEQITLEEESYQEALEALRAVQEILLCKRLTEVQLRYVASRIHTLDTICVLELGVK